MRYIIALMLLVGCSTQEHERGVVRGPSSYAAAFEKDGVFNRQIEYVRDETRKKTPYSP